MTTTTLIPEPTFTGACPDWCTLAERDGHGVSNLEFATGRYVREHASSRFGPYLSAGADEYVDAPGILHRWVSLKTDGEDLTEEQLVGLAAQASDAADWLRSHR